MPVFPWKIGSTIVKTAVNTYSYNLGRLLWNEMSFRHDIQWTQAWNTGSGWNRSRWRRTPARLERSGSRRNGSRWWRAPAWPRSRQMLRKNNNIIITNVIRQWPQILQALWAFMRSLLLTLMLYCLQFSIWLQFLCCTCYQHVMSVDCMWSLHK